MTFPFRRHLDTRRPTRLSTPLRVVLAITALLCWGSVQSQVTQTAASSPATELRFRDFFRTPIGPAGVEMSDKLRQADGQTVRLVGYMVQQQNVMSGRFMLTPRPVQMSENADGDADDLPATTVMIYLDPSRQDWVVPYVRGLVTVSGQLSVSRLEEADGRVSWVRLQLDADATRSMNAFEVAGYLHSLQHKH